MNPLDTAFAALAHPVRRAIVARLSQSEASVKELMEPFSISPPAITKHLRVLEAAGLIVRSRDAQRRPCRLNPAPLADIAHWVDEYRRFWEESFDRLEQYLAAMPSEPKPSKSTKSQSRKRSPNAKRV
jgi:DNA-binding transcriptional ArsR family regulator